MFQLVMPRPTKRITSETLIWLASPICLRPLLRKTTPTASRIRPMIRMMTSLAMLQICVADEFDFEFLHKFADGRADQRVVLVFKVIKRGMGVKLGITGRELREKITEVGLVNECVLQESENVTGRFNAETTEL